MRGNIGYRENWFKANKGRKLPFKRGLWYRCVSCGNWFHKSDIEIDHCIPVRKGDAEPVDYSLDVYFRENKDVVKLIHLSSIKGSGYDIGKHGIPFTEDSKGYIGLYNKYQYNCPLTLEVEEKDYCNPVGALETLRLLNLYESGL